MSKHIPEKIDPFRLAEQGIHLSGSLEMGSRERLHSAGVINIESIQSDLQFGMDEQGIAYLKGRANVRLALECQRCMHPFNYEIMPNFLLGVVRSLEDTKTLPASYEPVLAAEEKLDIPTLLEDEILLELPIVPMHSLEECKAEIPLADSKQNIQQKENPFRVLKSLKVK